MEIGIGVVAHARSDQPGTRVTASGDSSRTCRRPVLPERRIHDQVVRAR
jgi:hypothetical protein